MLGEVWIEAVQPERAFWAAWSRSKPQKAVITAQKSMGFRVLTAKDIEMPACV
jgi:hypothetical protein